MRILKFRFRLHYKNSNYDLLFIFIKMSVDNPNLDNQLMAKPIMIPRFSSGANPTRIFTKKSDKSTK